MTRTLATVFVLMLFLCPLLGFLSPEPEPPDMEKVDIIPVHSQEDPTCLTKSDLDWLQQTVSSLANRTDHMTVQVANHTAGSDRSSRRQTIMATWLELFHLHDEVTGMYVNFTSWIKGQNWTEESQQSKIHHTQVQANLTRAMAGSGSDLLFDKLWNEIANLRKNLTRLTHKNEYTFSQFVGSLSELDIKSAINSQRVRQLQQKVLSLQKFQSKLEYQWRDMQHLLENQTQNGFKEKLLDRIKFKSVPDDDKEENNKNMPEFTTKTTDEYDDKMLDKLHDVIQALEKRITHVNGSVEQLHQFIQNLRSTYDSAIEQVHAKMDVLAKNESRKHTKITRESCNGFRRHLADNSCYFLPDMGNQAKLYTWWDARYVCKKHLGDEADLVAIETKREMDAIKSMLHNHFGGIEEFWIGASDIESEGNWIWMMGMRPLTLQSYKNWEAPSRANPDSNCMSMLQGYIWAQEPCFYERIPICELRLN